MGVVGGQGAGEEVGGGAVEVVPAAVVAAGGAGVGVAEGVLDVLQRCAEGEGFGGEGVPQAVWGDRVRGLNAGGVGQPAAGATNAACRNTVSDRVRPAARGRVTPLRSLSMCR